MAARLGSGARGPIVILALGLALLCSGAAARLPAEIPVAEFFRPPQNVRPVLSPDGRRLALIVRTPEGRAGLAVADATSPYKPVGLAKFQEGDIDLVAWVNDRRLLVGARPADPEAHGYTVYALDSDGGEPKSLGSMNRGFRLLRDGSDDIVVVRSNAGRMSHDRGSTSPVRLNTRTGVGRDLVRDEPRHAVDWIFDARGRAIAVRSIEWDGDTRVWWRDDRDEWQLLDRYGIFDVDRSIFTPIGGLPDGRLLVRARRTDPERTAALFAYDPRERKLDVQPLLALEGHDFDGLPIADRRTGMLYGASFTSDAPGVAWFHPELVQIQKRIDALLPSTNNRFTCESCLEQRWFVVAAGTDRHDDVYHLFDREAEGPGAMKFLASARIRPEKALLAERFVERVPARDGARIPVYVTRPAGKGPWPAVVLVHGGPWVRGSSLGYDGEAQFLASRGYLVVEPEFRGSLGYGDTWFRASFGQWGLAMQDDVTDATRWAIARGLADPDRIAIAGGSYGGYAALMGVLREPALYKAAVNWVGVTDIGLMFTLSWSDYAASTWHREAMPVRIGDPDKLAEQFRRTSPLRRAAEIRRPVLMAYGGLDRRVPIAHGERMRDALVEGGNKEVEWIVYPEDGHGFQRKSRIDFWTRVEAFLAKHLKP